MDGRQRRGRGAVSGGLDPDSNDVPLSVYCFYNLRGPRVIARRQRAASHIRAIESGPPETASTIAGAAFQSANRPFAAWTEMAE